VPYNTLINAGKSIVSGSSKILKLFELRLLPRLNCMLHFSEAKKILAECAFLSLAYALPSQLKRLKDKRYVLWSRPTEVSQTIIPRKGYITVLLFNGASSIYAGLMNPKLLGDVASLV
jgi:hypothetical protein